MARPVALANLDDPRLAPYRDLKRTNATRAAAIFIVEGEKLFDRLLASRFPVVSAVASDRFAPAVAPRLPEGVPLYTLPERAVEALVGFNFHRGVLACGRRLPWPTADDLAAALGATATLVVAPRIDNPENLGAIVRIADVFGIDAVLVGDRCPDPLSRRVLRVSMGTSLRTPVLAPDDLAVTLHCLRADHGFELVATALEPPCEPIGRFVRTARTALLLRSEGTGLDPSWFAICDRRVTIPMRPAAESLNVAVAAGVLLYHLGSGLSDHSPNLPDVGPPPGPTKGETTRPGN